MDSSDFQRISNPLLTNGVAVNSPPLTTYFSLSMKKTLFLAALITLSSIAVQAATVVITFGVNSLAQGTSSMDGTYLGEQGKVNLIKTGSSGGSYTSGALKNFDGSSTGITLVTGAGACGGQGVLTADNIQSSHNPDNSSKFFDTFGSDITTGNNGGCINKNSGSYTMQMRGLSAGIYTLTMLVGRGNSFGTASSTYDLTGNIEGLSATLLDYSAGSNASLSGTTLFSESGAGEWALVEYTFTVTEDNTTLSLTSNGTGNINALALSSIPEPATASLGLLGLAVLAMRRRRA